MVNLFWWCCDVGGCEFQGVCYVLCSEPAFCLHLSFSILDESTFTAFFGTVMLSRWSDAFPFIIHFGVFTPFLCSSLCRMVGRFPIHLLQ